MSRAQEAARAQGVALFKWRLPITGHWALKLTQAQAEALYEACPRLWGFFFEWASTRTSGTARCPTVGPSRL